MESTLKPRQEVFPFFILHLHWYVIMDNYILSLSYWYYFQLAFLYPNSVSVIKLSLKFTKP